ncbi:MAG: hypothetical protein K2L64_00210 [Ureaplasma sp.]|nr:hypothetical protein [Ureaplasma sp.]
MKNNKAKKIIFSLLIIVLLSMVGYLTISLTSCTTNSPGDLSPGVIINQIFPNVWVFVAQLIAGAVLFLVLLFLIWKPTNNMLEKRQKLIADEIEDAQKMKSLAETELTEAKNKAKLIIEQSYSLSSSMIDNAEIEAKSQSEKIINSTNELIKNEKIKIKNEAENEMIDIIFKTTEALLKKNISQSDNEKLIKEFIEGLSINE